MKHILIIAYVLFPMCIYAQTTYDKTQNKKITALQKAVATLVTANTKNAATIKDLKKSVQALESVSTKNKTDITSIQNSSKRSGDTALKNSVAALSKTVSWLKLQVSAYKASNDSLKWVIKSNTIKVDTTSGSDFTIKNGVMVVNKSNLSVVIKREVLKWVPVDRATVKKKKK